MSHVTQFELVSLFPSEPEFLVKAGQRLPLNNEDLVPVAVQEGSYVPHKPALELLSNGAVSLSLGRPFGFYTRLDGYGVMTESQKTDGIVISPVDDRENGWALTLNTPESLTYTDRKLYDLGMNIYSMYALQKLTRSRNN